MKTSICVNEWILGLIKDHLKEEEYDNEDDDFISVGDIYEGSEEISKIYNGYGDVEGIHKDCYSIFYIKMNESGYAKLKEMLSSFKSSKMKYVYQHTIKLLELQERIESDLVDKNFHDEAAARDYKGKEFQKVWKMMDLLTPYEHRFDYWVYFCEDIKKYHCHESEIRQNPEPEPLPHPIF